jgi:formylmethanofuran dehydrogenase subunit B
VAGALGQGCIVPTGPGREAITRTGPHGSLRRTATGWKRVSWDQALDEAAERLAAARAEHGSLSLLYH